MLPLVTEIRGLVTGEDSSTKMMTLQKNWPFLQNMFDAGLWGIQQYTTFGFLTVLCFCRVLLMLANFFTSDLILFSQQGRLRWFSYRPVSWMIKLRSKEPKSVAPQSLHLVVVRLEAEPRLLGLTTPASCLSGSPCLPVIKPSFEVWPLIPHQTSSVSSPLPTFIFSITHMHNLWSFFVYFLLISARL